MRINGPPRAVLRPGNIRHNRTGGGRAPSCRVTLFFADPAADSRASVAPPVTRQRRPPPPLRTIWRAAGVVGQPARRGAGPETGPPRPRRHEFRRLLHAGRPVPPGPAKCGHRAPAAHPPRAGHRAPSTHSPGAKVRAATGPPPVRRRSLVLPALLPPGKTRGRDRSRVIYLTDRAPVEGPSVGDPPGGATPPAVAQGKGCYRPVRFRFQGEPYRPFHLTLMRAPDTSVVWEPRRGPRDTGKKYTLQKAHTHPPPADVSCIFAACRDARPRGSLRRLEEFDACWRQARSKS
jgi:hypothetical protein